MNLILLRDGDRLPDGRFRVGGARAAHLRDVLRAEPGRELRVGLLEGPLGTGTLVEADAEGAVLECRFEEQVPERPPLDLILAVPRAKSLRKLLPEIAALGVDRLVLLRTWRVAKPYLSATILRPEVHGPLLHDGLEQARATREPRVTVEPLFRPFAEDRLPGLLAGATGLVAHPGAAQPLAGVRIGPAERVVLAVGPEGGFLPYEVDALSRAGMTPVTLGPRTLRVETAAVALLAQIDLLRRLEGGSLCR